MLVIGGGSRSAAWRQLLADASGAAVEVPLEEEAGCLGAAIQAMYVEAQVSGRAQSFAEIAARCVKVDAARSAQPNAEKREAYRKAREQYQSALTSMYS